MDGKMKSLNVLYEDNHLIFIEKPVNVPTQADISGDEDVLTMVKAYIKEKYNKPGNVYAGLVHRLDRPVGGVMCVAKTSKAASRVSEQIAGRTSEKIYLAVIEGEMQKTGLLEDYLIKDPKTNTTRAQKDERGGAKYAALSYEVLSRKGGISLVKIRLHTGRSHQIRVQFSSRNHPLWGDNRYGHGKPGQQIALWAHELSIDHPTTKERLTVTCPPPNKFPWNEFEIE